jgi:hypothetical protein
VLTSFGLLMNVVAKRIAAETVETRAVDYAK